MVDKTNKKQWMVRSLSLRESSVIQDTEEYHEGYNYGRAVDISVRNERYKNPLNWIPEDVPYSPMNEELAYWRFLFGVDDFHQNDKSNQELGLPLFPHFKTGPLTIDGETDWAIKITLKPRTVDRWFSDPLIVEVSERQPENIPVHGDRFYDGGGGLKYANQHYDPDDPSPPCDELDGRLSTRDALLKLSRSLDFGHDLFRYAAQLFSDGLSVKESLEQEIPLEKEEMDP